MENRRITRSTFPRNPAPKDSEEERKSDQRFKTLVRKYMKAGQFMEAKDVLEQHAQAERYSHWVKCKKFECDFELGYPLEKGKIIQMLEQITHQGCNDCLNLFHKLFASVQTEEYPSIEKMIKDALKYERTAEKIKKSLISVLNRIKEEKFMKPATRLDLIRLTNVYQGREVEFPDLDIRIVENEFRVVDALQHISPYQPILVIPKKQMITVESAKNTCAQVRQVSRHQNRLKSPKHTLLAVFLLMEKKRMEKSYYYNYITCLPKRLQHFPYYYTVEELEQLYMTTFLPILIRKKIEMREDYQTILEILPGETETITEEAFMWARLTVSSRVFGLVVGNKKIDALVPIADMLNHKVPKSTNWYYNETDEAFHLDNGQQTIFAGEQITDSYGNKCNSRFLLNYGFTTLENQYNEVSVTLKRRRHDRSRPTVKITTNLDSDEFRMVLNYYRQFNSRDRVNRRARRGMEEGEEEEMEVNTVEFTTKANQAEAWRLIEQTFQERLEEYKTTIRFDEGSLRHANLTENMQNIMILRLGQKKILQFYIKMAKTMIRYFEHGTVFEPNLYLDYMKTIRDFEEDFINSQ